MPRTATQENRQSRKPTGKIAQSATNPDSAETEDHVYGLVSVLYHSLQGAQTCEQYTSDAERAGDDELVRFFEQCRATQSEQAQRAKQLLVARSDDEDEDEDEDEDDTEEDNE